MIYVDITTKVCFTCKEEKQIADFCKDKNRKDGRSPYCSDCRSARLKERYAKFKDSYNESSRADYRKNKEKYIDRAANWAKQNKEKRIEIVKEYVKRNPEKRSLSQKNHRESNPGLYAAHYKMRQTRKKRAMPVWACEESIKAIYRQCAFVNRMTGIKHHVDHYYPLTSDIVCGLHNEFNLRIIPAVENLSKGNKLPTGGHHEC